MYILMNNHVVQQHSCCFCVFSKWATEIKSPLQEQIILCQLFHHSLHLLFQFLHPVIQTSVILKSWYMYTKSHNPVFMASQLIKEVDQRL